MKHAAGGAHGYDNGHGNGYGGPAPVSAVSGPSPNTPIGGNSNGGWPLAYGGGGHGQTPIANEYLNNYPSSNNYHNGGSGAGAVVTPLTPYHSNNPHAFSNNWSPHPAHDGMYSNNTHANHNGPSREIDDFSRDVGATMRHVQDDEDTEPLTAGSSMHNYPIAGAGGAAVASGGGGNNTHLQPYQQHPSAPGSSGSMTSMSSYTPSRRGDRPLWQQTRRQSRNLMWL